MPIDTTTYGPNPLGEQACSSTAQGCLSDGLNVDIDPQVNVGAKPYPGTIFWDTQTANYSCDGGTNGTGVFQLDSPGGGGNACWYDGDDVPQIPAVQFVASSSR